jgi:hypothetical protein
MIDVLLGAPLIFVCVLRALCLKEQSRWALDHWNGTGWYRHLFFCYLLLCIFAYFQIFQSVPLRKLHLSYCAWLHRIASQQGRQRYAARQEFTDKKRISKRLVLFSYWKNVDCSSSKLRKGNVWTYFSLFVIRTRLLQCVLPQNTGCETFTCKLDRLDKLDSNLALRRIQRRGWVFYCDCLEDNGLLRFSLPPLSTRPRTRPRENAEVENGPEMSLVHLMSRTNCEPRPVDISCALQWCIRVYLTCVLLVNNWIMMHCGSSSCRRSAIAWREAGFAGLVS